MEFRSWPLATWRADSATIFQIFAIFRFRVIKQYVFNKKVNNVSAAGDFQFFVKNEIPQLAAGHMARRQRNIFSNFRDFPIPRNKTVLF